MRIEPELGGCSIVLVGHFNPLIFSPAWFEKNGIVTTAEAEAATVGVIHPEIASFTLGKNQIQVEQGRFSAETSEAPWIALHDFVLKTFGEFLSHTPINQMGINRSVHFSVGSEDARNKLGHLLAPLEPWGQWGKELAHSKPTARGGFSHLTMLQPKIPSGGRSGGHIQAQIAPSIKVRGNAGIFMQINDHHNFRPINETIGCEEVMVRLAQEFESSLKHSEQIIDQIMALKGND